MKHFYILILFTAFSIPSFSQLNEEWLHSENPLIGITETHFRQVGDNVIIKAEMFEGGSHEQAMSISTNGVQNWFDAYTNFQECTNCGLQGISDIAISSAGDMYSVGFQPASPFGGAYFSKQNIEGDYEFINEYFVGNMFKEFYYLDLSDDEQNIYIVGEDMDDNEGYQKVYKMDTDGNTIASSESSSYFPSTLDVNEDKIYVSQPDFGMLFIEQFDDNLQLQWTYSLELPNYGLSALMSQKLPNGDMLYLSLGENNNTGFKEIILVHLHEDGTAEHTTIPTLFDSNYVAFLQDFYYENNLIGLTYFARGFDVVNEPQGIQGGKGGPTVNYLVVENYNLDFSQNYSQIIEPFNGNYENALNLSKIKIDQSGNSILCYGEDYNTPELGSQKNLVVLLLDVNGNEIDRYTAPPVGMQYPYGSFMPSEGTFYVQGSYGEDGAQNNWSVVKFTYSIESGIVKSTKANLSAYPNPFTDQLVVRGIKTGEIFDIIDITGKLVKSFKSQSENEMIDLSFLSPGIYMICSEMHSEVLRIVKD
ncbi:MAG: T9SS type A sorting domain-containing protein [Flavobacteriales bacterium]